MVYKYKYGLTGFSMHHSRLITGIESMESTMAYGEEGILKGYCLRSPSIPSFKLFLHESLVNILQQQHKAQGNNS